VTGRAAKERPHALPENLVAVTHLPEGNCAEKARGKRLCLFRLSVRPRSTELLRLSESVRETDDVLRCEYDEAGPRR